MKYPISIICLLVFMSCKMTNDYSGHFTEKHYGFLFSRTLLILNLDSTFEYDHVFDMMHSHGKGTYKIGHHNIIYLNYSSPEVDTFYFNDSSIKHRPIWVDGQLKIVFDTLHFTNYFTHFNYYPKTFIFSKGRIYSTNNGKRKIRSKQYSPKPKYIFFGSHWTKRKHFLIRIKENE